MGHQPTPVRLSSPVGFVFKEYEGGCKRCALRVHVTIPPASRAGFAFGTHLTDKYKEFVPECPNAPRTMLVTLPEDFDIPF